MVFSISALAFGAQLGIRPRYSITNRAMIFRVKTVTKADVKSNAKFSEIMMKGCESLNEEKFPFGGM